MTNLNFPFDHRRWFPLGLVVHRMRFRDCSYPSTILPACSHTSLGYLFGEVTESRCLVDWVKRKKHNCWTTVYDAFRVTRKGWKSSRCILHLSEMWLPVSGRCSRESMSDGAELWLLKPGNPRMTTFIEFFHPEDRFQSVTHLRVTKYVSCGARR